MKKVLLLRHAMALMEEELDDKNRPLSGEGLDSIEKLANELKETLDKPDFIICSTAVRTKQTLNKLIELWSDIQEVSVHYTDNAYNSSADALLNEIQNADDEFNVILLVTHNPAISQLTKELAGDGMENDLQNLDKGFAPANCASIVFYVDHWTEVDRKKGKLVRFINDT